MKKINFFSLNLNELTLLLHFNNSNNNFKFNYRSKQLFDWVYSKGIINLNQMNNLPLKYKEIINEKIIFGLLKTEKEQISNDGTIKRAIKLSDQQIIESVLMKYKDGRRTACISSQVGCAMKCKFCATGQMGFSRQLTDIEIFEQAAIFSCELKQKGERLSNIVFMGMGEPLNNYKNVLSAINLIHTNLGIGMRHITISTVGIVPRIKQLAIDNPQVGLAISLHQSNDERRSSLIPINDKYPLNELLDACRYYIEKTNRRISFEWALIVNQTDQPEHAHDLGKLLKGILCHVNLIPLNPTNKFDGKPTNQEGVDAFIKILNSYGIPATSRMRRGIDIQAGCGQLSAAIKERNRLKSEVSSPLLNIDNIEI